MGTTSEYTDYKFHRLLHLIQRWSGMDSDVFNLYRKYHVQEMTPEFLSEHFDGDWQGADEGDQYIMVYTWERMRGVPIRMMGKEVILRVYVTDDHYVMYIPSLSDKVVAQTPAEVMAYLELVAASEGAG